MPRQVPVCRLEAGGIRLESGETACKYTVYLINTAGCMLVGDVTV